MFEQLCFVVAFMKQFLKYSNSKFYAQNIRKITRYEPLYITILSTTSLTLIGRSFTIIFIILTLVIVCCCAWVSMVVVLFNDFIAIFNILALVLISNIDTNEQILKKEVYQLHKKSKCPITINKAHEIPKNYIFVWAHLVYECLILMCFDRCVIISDGKINLIVILCVFIYLNYPGS